MHGRVFLGVGKGVLFREVSSVQVYTFTIVNVDTRMIGACTVVVVQRELSSGSHRSSSSAGSKGTGRGGGRAASHSQAQGGHLLSTGDSGTPTLKQSLCSIER